MSAFLADQLDFKSPKRRNKPRSRLELNDKLAVELRDNGSVVYGNAGSPPQSRVIENPVEVGLVIECLAKVTCFILSFCSDDVGGDAKPKTSITPKFENAQRCNRGYFAYTPSDQIADLEFASSYAFETIANDGLGDAGGEILGNI